MTLKKFHVLFVTVAVALALLCAVQAAHSLWEDASVKAAAVVASAAALFCWLLSKGGSCAVAARKAFR